MDKKLSKIKASGSFRRKFKKNKDLLLNQINTTIAPSVVFIEPSNEVEACSSNTASASPAILSSPLLENNTDLLENYSGDDLYFSLSEGEDDFSETSKPRSDHRLTNIELNQGVNNEFIDFLRNWSIQFNIPQVALKPLMNRINLEFNASLPTDPRTLMRKCVFILYLIMLNLKYIF